MNKIFTKIKDNLKEILTGVGIIAGIIISFIFGWKTKEKTIKNSKWKKIKDKDDHVELYDEEEKKWKEIRLPENKKGEQIKSNEIKTINISEGGKINVTTKSGATDRRNVSSLDDDVFSPLDL